MNKIKIALVLFKTDLTGGPGNILINALSAADKTQFEYIAIASKPGKLTDKLSQLGIRVLITPMPEISKKGIVPYLLSILKAFIIFRNEKIKIAHFYFDRYRDSVLLAAKIAKVKSLIHIHGPAQKYDSSWVKFADYFVLNSEYSKNSANYPIDIKKQKVIYYGINPENYHVEVQKSKKKQIAMLSRIHPAKNIETALEIFAGIKYRDSYTLLIAGNYQDPDYLIMLQTRAISLGIENQVKFIGHTNNVSEIYNQSLFLLHTALNEAFGYVFLEAGLFSLPSVAFNSGGIPEVIKNDETGFLFDTGDIAGMIDKVEYLIENPAELERIGNMALKGMINFTSQKHQMQIEKYYLEILQNA